MDAPARLVCVGALALLSLTLLLTLIQHPVLTICLILIALWLFLHPHEAEAVWRSVAPVITEAFSKAVQEAQLASVQATIAPSTECPAGQDASPMDEISESTSKNDGINKRLQSDAKLDDIFNELDALLTINDDDEGDIEIEPLSSMDRPDLLQPSAVHPLGKSSDKKVMAEPQKLGNPNATNGPGLMQKQPLHNAASGKLINPAVANGAKILQNQSANGPIPLPNQPMRNQNGENQMQNQQTQKYSGPDLIIMNAQAPAQKKYFGNGEDEFYVTSVDYEHWDFGPLIITEQVPRTTEWFEQLTEQKKAEWMQEQMMRERLGRSVSRVPSD